MTYFRSFICILLMLPCFANAGPMRYKIDQPDPAFFGGFTYDDTTMLFSIDILDTASGFGERWTSAVGDALGFQSSGANYGTSLEFFFDTALGTEIPGSPVSTSWVVFSQALGTFEGTLTVSSSVPAPATLALFGLGLAGLGWSRRKQHS